MNIAIREFKATGKAVIIMTHRPHAIAECDLLMAIENGSVTAYGPRDEVLPRTQHSVRAVASLPRRREVS
jgi:ATP-binding cassette subfamily C protein